MEQKVVLDACCGGRMCWFEKKHPNVVYMDNRQGVFHFAGDRALEIKPDIVGDFRAMPFADESFYLVLFDPPHLRRAGDNSWLAQKYGRLGENWQVDIRQGFSECMRVLKPYGTLVFKWNEEQISTGDLLKTIEQQPLFGQRRGKTIWLVFMKGVVSDGVLRKHSR